MKEDGGSKKRTGSRFPIKTLESKMSHKTDTKAVEIKVPFKSKVNVLYFNSATGRVWIKTITTRVNGSQTTEEMELCTNAYSGRGLAKNNPYAENHKGNPENQSFNAGTIPRGEYKVSNPFDHDKFGFSVFRLTPIGNQEMYGRDGFLIHGDGSATRRGEVSQGCIIMPRSAREKIAEMKVHNLIVEPHFSKE
jgi:hypothetical protein